jgi:hypothetical protein
LVEHGLKPKQVATGLFDAFGEQTIDVMRDGAHYLAHIWQSAWDTGVKIGKLPVKQLKTKDMIDLYTNSRFLPSHTLDTIAPVLSQAGAAQGSNNRHSGNGATMGKPGRHRKRFART